MRRVAGVHMRASRHRIVALTNQEGRRLAPSLKTFSDPHIEEDSQVTARPKSVPSHPALKRSSSQPPMRQRHQLAALKMTMKMINLLRYMTRSMLYNG
ncbi:hypothetical protein OSTOST_01637 [Ostertagia ostertagi]